MEGLPDEQVELVQFGDGIFQSQIAAGLLEFPDKIGGAGEEHAVAVFHQRQSDGGTEVRLAHPWRAEQQDIAALADPAVTGGDGAHMRFGNHWHGAEVETVERHAGQQTRLGQVPPGPAPVAFGQLGLDDVMTVDHVTMRTIGVSPATRHLHQETGPKKQLQPIIIDPNTKTVPDQPWRYGVEDLLQPEPARRRDTHHGFLEIGGPARGQRLETGVFRIDAPGVARVDATDDFVDEAATSRQILELRGPPQWQRVLDGTLEMVMWPLDRPILVSNPFRIAAEASSIGTTSVSKMSAKGSARRRPRGSFFCDGRVGSF